MKRKLKTFLAKLLCVGFMMFCVLPVMAVDVDNCPHTDVRIDVSYERKVVNSVYHSVTYHKFYVCKACEKTIRTYEQELGNEGHSLKYEDAGHKDSMQLHYYTVFCRECSYRTTVMVDCYGSPHKTPW